MGQGWSKAHQDNTVLVIRPNGINAPIAAVLLWHVEPLSERCESLIEIIRGSKEPVVVCYQVMHAWCWLGLIAQDTDTKRLEVVEEPPAPNAVGLDEQDGLSFDVVVADGADEVGVRAGDVGGVLITIHPWASHADWAFSGSSLLAWGLIMIGRRRRL